MMNLIPMFSNFVVYDVIDIDVSSACINYLKNKEQYHFSGKEPEFQKLFQEFQNRVNSLSSDLLCVKKPLTITNKWMNKGSNINITEPHQHATSILSGVFYVRAEQGKSCLKFINPNSILASKLPQTERENILNRFNEFNSSSWSIDSNKNMLLIFPSWIYHYVVSNDVDRISIAFDTNISVV